MTGVEVHATARSSRRSACVRKQTGPLLEGAAHALLGPLPRGARGLLEAGSQNRRRRMRAGPAARMWREGARAVLAVGLGAALEALLAWLLRRREAAAVREVLFFPSRVTCVEELLGEAPCLCPLPHGESALGRLLARVMEARRSLELCVFAFSSSQLCRAVVLLHRRHVRVRVVVDTDYMAARGSQVWTLRKAGIQVRHDQESGYMHHKFAIIDKKLLITGSLNWTNQAIQSNRENVLVLEDQNCVNIFLAEFEKMWEHYNPANYTFFSKYESPGLGKGLS